MGASLVYERFQSNGACDKQCNPTYAFAVIQGHYCWCSDYAPGETTSNEDCNSTCPGIDTERCGSTTNQLYGYIPLGRLPAGTQGAPSSTTQAVSVHSFLESQLIWIITPSLPPSLAESVSRSLVPTFTLPSIRLAPLPLATVSYLIPPISTVVLSPSSSRPYPNTSMSVLLTERSVQTTQPSSNIVTLVETVTASPAVTSSSTVRCYLAISSASLTQVVIVIGLNSVCLYQVLTFLHLDVLRINQHFGRFCRLVVHFLFGYGDIHGDIHGTNNYSAVYDDR